VTVRHSSDQHQPCLECDPARVVIDGHHAVREIHDMETGTADQINEATQVNEIPDIAPRLRILSFMVAYPTFSETYMHEEVRSLRETYDIRIVTYSETERPREESFEHDLVAYTAPCLQYGNYRKVNPYFTSAAQRTFINQVDDIITEFKPDILHAHYLGLAVLLDFLSTRHSIPWTLRSHSMDVLSEPRGKLKRLCAAANSDACAGILAFPAHRGRLEKSGLEASKIIDAWPVLPFERFHRSERRAETRRIMCAGPAIEKKAHRDFIDLAHSMRGSGREFDLYAAGPAMDDTKSYNLELGDPVTITYADPEVMPQIYPLYDWVVYPSDCSLNKVGLPMVLAEAMASGVGVCWQELPGRREEQLDFLGGAGHLFSDITQVPALLADQYDEARRVAGIESARRFDIEGHKYLLSDIWDSLGPRIPRTAESRATMKRPGMVRRGLRWSSVRWRTLFG
jgi:glycosyltransferase involved in cell wall biosynthesis